MYILVLARSFPTDKYPLQGIFEFDQAKALVSQGHKVVMLAIDLRSIRRWRKFGLNVFQRNGVKVYLYNFPLGAIPTSCVAFFSNFLSRMLMKRIKKDEGLPDLIHAHFCYLQGYIGGKISKKYQIPLVITEHSSTLIYNYNRRYDNYYKKGYDQASGIICVSNALKESIKNRYGYDSTVIPNIVDLNYFKYYEKNKGENYTFVTVGNLIYRKGMDVLLNAFSKLTEDNVKLIIIGDGSERKYLEQQSKNLGINEKVSFLGRLTRENISFQLQKSDCFVLASRSETFGVVYIEALATGTPVIATSCGGSNDIITKENGLLVSIDNVDELALAMKYMVQNRDIYEHQKIAEKTLEMYSSKTIRSKLTCYFSSIIEHF